MDSAAQQEPTKRILDSILEAPALGVLIVGEGGRIMLANRGAELLFSYSREQLTALAIDALLPDQDRDTPPRQGEFLGRATGGKGIEATGRRKDGTDFPVEVNFSYIGPRSAPLATVFVADISARRAAEAALRIARDRFQAILNAATQVAIIATDMDGVITVYNSGAERILGYAAEDVVGKMKPLAFHVPAELEQHARQLSGGADGKIEGFAVLVEIARRDGFDRREWTCVRKDGAHVTLDLGVTEVHDARGEVTGFLGVGADITSRKEAEESLRATKERYERAVRGTNDGIWDWTPEEGEVYVSARVGELLGYAEGEFRPTRQNWREMIHPEDRERVLSGVSRHLDQGVDSFDVEIRLRCKDGEYRWFRSRGSALRDAAGKPLRAAGSLSDIGERKRLEQQLEKSLRETDTLLRTLVRAAPLAILTLDGEGMVTSWNEAAEMMFGWTAGEVLGKRIPIIPVEDEDVFLLTMAKVIGGNTVLALDRQRVRKDGTMVDVSISAAPLRGPGGGTTGVVVVVEDVSEQKRAHRALRDTEERYRRFVEMSPDAMFINQNGRVVFVNPAAVRLFGAASAADLIGKSPFDLYHPDCHAEVGERIRRVLESGDPAPPLELIVRKLDGSPVPVEAAATVFTDQGQTCIQVTLHDLTSRRKAEAELRAMARMLMTAQEDEARWIARELHDDLSQRLAVSAIDLGRLAAGPGGAATRERLIALQRNLSELSAGIRVMSHRIHPSSLDDLGLCGALEMLCVEFSEREKIPVKFESVLDGKPPRPVAACLYRVAQESLRNVSLHAGAKSVTVSLRRDADRILLSVKDSGVGFVPEQAEGGLGLVSMRERVGLAGGVLEVQSRPGHGTEVRASVPFPR